MLYTQKDLLLYSSPQGKDKQIMDINSPELKKNAEITKRYVLMSIQIVACKAGVEEDDSVGKHRQPE